MIGEQIFLKALDRYPIDTSGGVGILFKRENSTFFRTTHSFRIRRADIEVGMHIANPATKIETVSIKTRRIETFSPMAQIAFIAICQHIDWLFAQVSSLKHDRQHPGSDSWVRETPPDAEFVLVKALPWDQRLTTLASLAPCCQEGVAILVRNDLLTAQDMQTIWEEFGDAFFSCPNHPALYSVIPHPDAQFQLLLFCLSNQGCNLLELPGVDISDIGPHLRSRMAKAQKIQEATDPFDDDQSPDDNTSSGLLNEEINAVVDIISRSRGGNLREINHKRLADVLGGLLKRQVDQ